MATIKHIQTPDGVTHDIGGGGGSTTYTLTKSGSTITLTGSGGDVSSVVDANTTYALSLSGHTLTLTPSSGSAQSVTIPDDNTTYTIGISGTTITLTPSSGTAQTVTIPDATTTSAGVMSASDKSKLNGIESGAEVNVQSDWNQSNSSADDYIKNKPSLATVATTGDYDDLTNKPSLATVATTGDYDDLTNKPTIPTVNDGTLTIKQNGVTLDTFTANQSGNTTVDITTSAGSTQNTWYATCATSGGTTAKVATTTTADFVLATGNSVKVRFSSGSNASSPTLNVDGTGAIAIKENNAVAPSTYTWKTGEVVEFVYDGTYFLIVDGGTATTSYYGVTKLSSSTSSTSTTLAATPSAVKDAYDLADSKSIVSVSQTVSSGTKIADITVNGTATDIYAPDEVYFAEYGVTSYSDIVTAINAGKAVYVDVANSYGSYNQYAYAWASSTELYFNRTHGDYNSPSIKAITVDSSDVWSSATYDLVSSTYIKTVNEQSLIGSGNVQITKSLTQAQYNALSPAEQNDGTAYFITDADPTPYSASPSAWVQMYHGNQAMNNTATKITGLTISQGGNYDEYFNVGTANQVTIKKTGGYRIDMAMRFSAVTNAANVKRISLYRNGSEFLVLMSRANSWEDFSTFYTQTLSVGDVLTMYGRSEDGNATASIERIYITPIIY